MIGATARAEDLADHARREHSQVPATENHLVVPGVPCIPLFFRFRYHVLPHSKLLGAFMPEITLRVNGSERKVDVSPDTPLLWVLRDTLQLTGTKFGCGAGLCGACTVHVDGEARRSCSTPVSQAAGKNITTIEGLSPASGLHPLQQAWIAEDVPQCGYCQVGQIMSAAALLAKTPQPSDDQITEAMSGNLCRCGTYDRIRRAIHRAAGPGGAR
jgi:isoquinoline 1-oxidoreductase alpha subunit